jgi:tetratricopeptide (TPR) repeat protein
MKMETESLNITQSLSGKNTLDYKISLSFLARCYYRLDNYQKAIEFETEALQIGESLSGKNTSANATSLRVVLKIK